jgi:hypothetical protein
MVNKTLTPNSKNQVAFFEFKVNSVGNSGLAFRRTSLQSVKLLFLFMRFLKKIKKKSSSFQGTLNGAFSGIVDIFSWNLLQKKSLLK